ncbi:MAG: Nif3-like dinuclear metal center hexameric protein [Gammaproteobacteria bacterium]|nr:Nif3-like dinuclear metal center hexameric protein [Gammaproteobacteria bacterium]MCH9762764.1 Nif3-like dinuclear metal center hexameric protein [Gammaproteobacteria bacterium]MCH9793666.1 Nif3-like dinuclear metal center hexameric protein [Planctomycetota bacterium]
MTTRTEYLKYLEDYLQLDSFKDYAPNGLQVEGRMDIRRIRTAVTASEEAIKIACEDEACMLLVHHGYFWRGENPVITGMKQRRIARLLKHDMNLLAYHLPIDCHPELGNNACMARRLNVSDVQSHAAAGTPHLLWTGRLPKAVTADTLAEVLNKTYQRQPQCISGGKQLIQHIAFCTGAAQDFIEDASALGVDAYISGEVSERTYYQAKELGVHYFACGHHATERDGIRTLGEHLAKRFGVEHVFIDSDNPV